VQRSEYALAARGEYKSDGGAFSAKATASRDAVERVYFGTWYRADGDVYDGTKDQLALDLKYDNGGLISVAAGGNLEWEDTDQLTNFSGIFVAGIDTKSAYGEVALRPAQGLTLTGAARLDDNSRFGSFDTYRGTIAYAFGPAKLPASYGTGAKAPGLYQCLDPPFGKPNPLAALLINRHVVVGQPILVPRDLVQELLGFQDPLGTVRRFELTLLRVDPASDEHPAPRGVFRTSIMVVPNEDSPLSIHLTGEIAVETETCRLAYVDLNGPVQLSSIERTAGGIYHYSAGGELNLSIQSGYDRTKLAVRPQ